MGLMHKQGRVVVKIDLQGKNSHTFENGQTIRLEREYNNLNRREVSPVNATVVSAENIPEGSTILIHHNSTHDSNRIFDYGELSGEAEADTVKYFSIPEEDCYAWLDDAGNPYPLKNFAFALRVYEPYLGLVQGVQPNLLKNVLYLTTSNLKGCVCGTLKAVDYQIVYQGIDGREKNLIRLRHSDDEEIEREEVIYIDHQLTDKVNEGKLFVGLSPLTATPIKTTTTNEIATYATNSANAIKS